MSRISGSGRWHALLDLHSVFVFVIVFVFERLVPILSGIFSNTPALIEHLREH
jgi:hypothetical protein